MLAFNDRFIALVLAIGVLVFGLLAALTAGAQAGPYEDALSRFQLADRETRGPVSVRGVAVRVLLNVECLLLCHTSFKVEKGADGAGSPRAPRIASRAMESSRIEVS